MNQLVGEVVNAIDSLENFDTPFQWIIIRFVWKNCIIMNTYVIEN